MTASLLASADTILGASPSSDPTAIVKVTGRTYQRYANRLALAASTTNDNTTTMRSQIGSLAALIPTRDKSSMAPSGKLLCIGQHCPALCSRVDLRQRAWARPCRG